MDERVKFSLLLDIYGSLLTEKQRDIMDLYYNDDLSLSEISENTNTSRQANFDLIKRCEKLLLDYEIKLKLLEKSLKEEEIKNNILSKLKVIKKNNLENIDSIIEEIKKDLNHLN